MTRWKAAGIHLALSVVIIGAIALGLIQVWYGWELFSLMGGARLLTILTICDILIGPLLTLVVYKAGKPSLKFDLFVITLLQIGFLTYGLHIMAQSRPVFIVGVADRFEFVFANELADEDLAKGSEPRFRKRSWTGPLVVGGQLGQTSQERYDLAMSGFAGKDIHLLPERFVDLEIVRDALMSKAQPAKLLADSSAEAKAKLESFAGQHGKTLDELVFLPLISRRARATMLLEAGSGALVGPVAVEPWHDLGTQK